MRLCCQVKLLKQRFEDALGPEGAKMVDISTIDGFQVRCAAMQLCAVTHVARCSDCLGTACTGLQYHSRYQHAVRCLDALAVHAAQCI